LPQETVVASANSEGEGERVNEGVAVLNTVSGYWSEGKQARAAMTIILAKRNSSLDNTRKQ
jgi:hypothetical protein